MSGERLMHTYNGILFSDEKKGAIRSWATMDEP
jgi:hypothetical protein